MFPNKFVLEGFKKFVTFAPHGIVLKIRVGFFEFYLKLE